jgi:hypothetical protein
VVVESLIVLVVVIPLALELGKRAKASEAEGAADVAATST